MKMLTRFGVAALAAVWATSMAWAQANLKEGTKGTDAGADSNAPVTRAAHAKPINLISQTPWFNNPAVRGELQLKENQFNELNQNYQQAWSRYHEGISKLAPNLTPEQRQLQVTALTNQFRKDFSRGLDSVISTPSDRQRYHQLDWQYRGYGAFSDPAVVDKLNLSDAQRRKFDQFGRDWDQQFNNWRRNYPENQDRVGQQLQEARRQMWDNINATLTAEQRETWRQMSGERYEFEPNVFFPAPTSSNTTLKPPLP